MRYRTLSKPLQTLHLSDFDFTLPPELIARAPLAERSASRLLAVVGGAAPDRSVALHDRHFRDLPSLLAPGDLLIANDSRVLHARLRGHKDTGGRVDMLIERLLGDFEALAQIRATHAPRPGSRLLLSGGISAEVLERRDMFYRVRFAGDRPVDRLLAEHGEVPLPPYLGRAAEADDAERYQTVFARAPGSVAAPTAGLHFDPPLLAELTRRGVALAPLTLHVGAGPFQPVRSEDLAAHHMHREWYRIPEATVRAIRRLYDLGFRPEWWKVGAMAARHWQALDALGAIAALGAPVQFGGGLRSLDDAARALEAGARRVILGTLAVREPEQAGEAVSRFGADAVAVALDARGDRVATHGWQQVSAWTPADLGRRFAALGVRHALFTDVSRDGDLSGVAVEATAALARETGLAVIASGGVASLDDLRALRAAGDIAGVVIGQALYRGVFTLPEALAAAE